ncbi:MAG: 30S ribosomal protein S7 [Patescibacteria group bacterium]|nr:30S ribosomal protein S7 [Patescibacteria group bacterium]MDD5567550.1 30S ribosomal protein S7 [Patescibacteria group bacterium]
MRGNKAARRKIEADPKHNNLIIAKFINYVMRRGKKSVAQAIIYDMLDDISKKTKQDPLEIFDRGLKNVTPILEVKSRRIGGANYQIPVEVRGDRRITLAMRWLIKAAQTRKGMPMSQKLAEEFIAAANNQGEAIKKKEDVHRMAEANRAFAHFA